MIGVHERMGGELVAKQIQSKVEAAEHFLKSRTEPEPIQSFLFSETEIAAVKAGVLRPCTAASVWS